MATEKTEFEHLKQDLAKTIPNCKSYQQIVGLLKWHKEKFDKIVENITETSISYEDYEHRINNACNDYGYDIISLEHIEYKMRVKFAKKLEL